MIWESGSRRGEGGEGGEGGIERGKTLVIESERD